MKMTLVFPSGASSIVTIADLEALFPTQVSTAVTIGGALLTVGGTIQLAPGVAVVASES